MKSVNKANNFLNLQIQIMYWNFEVNLYHASDLALTDLLLFCKCRSLVNIKVFLSHIKLKFCCWSFKVGIGLFMTLTLFSLNHRIIFQSKIFFMVTKMLKQRIEWNVFYVRPLSHIWRLKRDRFWTTIYRQCTQTFWRIFKVIKLISFINHNN